MLMFMPPNETARALAAAMLAVSLNDTKDTSPSNLSSTVSGESVSTYVTLVLPSKFMFPRIISPLSGPRTVALTSTKTLP